MKKAYLAGGIAVLLLITYLTLHSNKEPVGDVKPQNKQIAKTVIKQKNSVKEKIIKTDKPTKSTNYKDIFKEPKEPQNALEQIREKEQIKILDKEAERLMGEADSFIAKNNLQVEKVILSDKKKEEQKKYNQKIQSLSNQLEELSNESTK